MVAAWRGFGGLAALGAHVLGFCLGHQSQPDAKLLRAPILRLRCSTYLRTPALLAATSTLLATLFIGLTGLALFLLHVPQKRDRRNDHAGDVRAIRSRKNELRGRYKGHELERAGAIFSSTSDTEVVLHGVARSRKPVREAIPEVLSDTEGAFSMLFLTPEALIAIRDPRGFRPPRRPTAPCLRRP